MEISKEGIEEFKKAHLEVYGYEISDAEAQEIAQRLIAFLRLVMRPLAKEDEEKPYSLFRE
jgi:hypothetical protein